MRTTQARWAGGLVVAVLAVMLSASNNGEFIHANPKSAAAQGSSNVTHGCVNLSIGDAKALGASGK